MSEEPFTIRYQSGKDVADAINAEAHYICKLERTLHYELKRTNYLLERIVQELSNMSENPSVTNSLTEQE